MLVQNDLRRDDFISFFSDYPQSNHIMFQVPAANFSLITRWTKTEVTSSADIAVVYDATVDSPLSLQ